MGIHAPTPTLTNRVRPDLSPTEWIVLGHLCDPVERRVLHEPVDDALEALRERGLTVRHSRMSALGIHVSYHASTLGRAAWREYQRS